MVRVVGVTLLFAIIASLEVPSLVRQKKRKEFILYGAILGIAFAISVLHILHVPIMNPNQLITQIVHMVVPR